MGEAAGLSPAEDYVEAGLNYIVDDGQTPVRYVDWPEEAHKEHIPSYEERQMRIHNGRNVAEPFDLQTHGFVLAPHNSAVQNFYDEGELKCVYHAETEKLIKDYSGAAHVLVFDHTIRTAIEERQEEGWIRGLAKGVHNDYTERSAAQRVLDFLPDGEAQEALNGRFAIMQTWRSIANVIESDPLAMCDGRTIPETGFIRNERRYRDRTAETLHISHHGDHVWYYFPRMTRNEAMVFKVFDSDPDAGVWFTTHTAFTDPTSPVDAAPRESIEMRALAFY